MELARSKGYSVRLAEPADRPHIFTAVQALMPGVDVERRHRWLYDDNPHGPTFTWIATDDATGAVAGVTSLFSRRMIIGAREVVGVLGGDGYVHPAFRRRGIATAMHGASRRLMKECGIEVMFGTPLDANRTPLAQHQTEDVVEIVRYVRPVGCRAFGLPQALDVLVRPLLRPRCGGLGFESMQGCDRRVDALWDQTRPELEIATVRDSAFYDWMFRRNPLGDPEPVIVTDYGRPIAACALQRSGRCLRVFDLLAPLAAWPRVLGAIIGGADGFDTVEFKLGRDGAEARGLARHGFLARGAKPLNVMVPDGSPYRTSYFDATRWFFTCI